MSNFPCLKIGNGLTISIDNVVALVNLDGVGMDNMIRPAMCCQIIGQGRVFRVAGSVLVCEVLFQCVLPDEVYSQRVLQFPLKHIG